MKLNYYQIRYFQVWYLYRIEELDILLYELYYDNPTTMYLNFS